MATMTIRNLDDDLKTLLRLRAARHGRSMEEEARNILRTALADRVEDDSGALLYAAFWARVEPLGGVQLELPPRAPQSEPPDISTPDAGK